MFLSSTNSKNELFISGRKDQEDNGDFDSNNFRQFQLIELVWGKQIKDVCQEKRKR